MRYVYLLLLTYLLTYLYTAFTTLLFFRGVQIVADWNPAVHERVRSPDSLSLLSLVQWPVFNGCGEISLYRLYIPVGLL